MRLLPVPPQILRLILLTIGIVGSYLVARTFLVPQSFGEYGWYRANALGELSSYPRTYAGKKACEDCHSDTVQKLAKGAHKNLACEGCHGPGEAHANSPDNKMVIFHYSLCVRCHEANPSRPSTHKQVVIKDHYTGSKCTDCHEGHSPIP